MKIFKILLPMTAIIGMALIWTSCQKDVSRSLTENQKNVSEPRLSGVVADDPIAVSKVPVIMSSDYLANMQDPFSRRSIGGIVKGGKRDAIAPTISITSPANGASVSGVFDVLVNASDNVGVKSVSLSVDGGAALTTSINSPFSNTWNSGTVSNGTHTLTVTATDAAGNKGTSSIQVNVNNVSNIDITPPTVSVTSPADGSAFDANTNVAIGLSASDNIGVSSLSLTIDGTLVGSSSGSAYSYTWSTAVSGPHTITATAKDAAGNPASKSVIVTINTVVIDPPPSLPSNFTLTMPPVMNQGGEGSCVALAVINARSFEQYNRTNASSYSTSTNILSPEFLFNETKVDAYCTGSALLISLNLIVSTGVCTWGSMPYTSTGCSLMPNSSQLAEAANYKIASYSKILKTDQTAIKTMIASKRALVSTYTIDDNFRNSGPGYIWNSFSTNPGAHALALCGYDDSKHAYLAVNAWGTTFGSAGYIWIDYDFLPTVSSDLFVMNF